MEQTTQESSAIKSILRMPDTITDERDQLNNDEMTVFQLIWRNQELSYEELVDLAAEEIHWSDPNKFVNTYASLVQKKVMTDKRPAVV